MRKVRVVNHIGKTDDYDNAIVFHVLENGCLTIENEYEEIASYAKGCWFMVCIIDDVQRVSGL